LATPTRKFSTLSGILWIGAFFCILSVYPLITSKRQHDFLATSGEATEFPDKFPLNVKLSVFRDASSGKKRAFKSKVTIEELIKESKAPILINFWATWCPPCLEELPSLEMFNRQIRNISHQNGSTNPLLITISVDDRIEDISKLESTLDFKPSFSVMYDREGELARSMGTTKFPETYLINSDGKILYKWLGPQDWLSNDALQQLKIHLQ